MKTANKCPYCFSQRCAPDLFECRTEACRDFDFGELTGTVTQSNLCRERCKVAKLKKKLEAMNIKIGLDAIEIKRLTRENDTLRNPKF